MSEPSFEHKPVLVEPLLRLLAPQPGQVVLDGTVGQGGHAAAILPLILPGGRYIGLDWDEAMLETARSRLTAGTPETVVLAKANYTDFPAILQPLGLAQVDHMLLDLGVNSAQLADPVRGFSFEKEGPLDMRYDQRQKRMALDLVNSLSEKELSDLFYAFGQEGLSRKIARRICQVRHGARITTTRTLARTVESVFASEGGGPGKIHPATRVFQALRVAVNRELENLERFLQRVEEFLRPGGKLAVISFHSLEDGLVKKFMRTAKAAGTWRELTPKPVIADAQEREENPRSRSAKLRVAQRLENKDVLT